MVIIRIPSTTGRSAKEIVALISVDAFFNDDITHFNTHSGEKSICEKLFRQFGSGVLMTFKSRLWQIYNH